MRITRQEAEDFLYYEAALLDERKFEDWLDLFTSDGIYWLPLAEDADPEQEPSVLYDDTAQRTARVYQLVHQPHYAQIPPSRTVHFISNVRVDDAQNGNDAIVRCNVAVSELRPGDHQGLQAGLGSARTLVGRCEYRLRHDRHWRIALKKVILIDADLPIFNLTFIV